MRIYYIYEQLTIMELRNVIWIGRAGHVIDERVRTFVS